MRLLWSEEFIAGRLSRMNNLLFRQPVLNVLRCNLMQHSSTHEPGAGCLQFPQSCKHQSIAAGRCSAREFGVSPGLVRLCSCRGQCAAKVVKPAQVGLQLSFARGLLRHGGYLIRGACLVSGLRQDTRRHGVETSPRKSSCICFAGAAILVNKDAYFLATALAPFPDGRCCPKS